MKKNIVTFILSIILLSIISPKLLAQKWFPVGAEWYWEETKPVWIEIGKYGSASNYYKYEVIKDTIVKDLPAKLIQKTFHSHNNYNHKPDTLILREENDKVYYYNYATFFPNQEPDDEFHLMLDFTLEVGDTLQVKMPQYFEADTARYVVLDSIYIDETMGVPLKVQVFVLYDAEGRSKFHKYKKIEVREKIIYGCAFMPFKNLTVAFLEDGESNCDCGYMEGESCKLRCYSDNSISYRSDPNVPCDTTYDTSIEECKNNSVSFYQDRISSVLHINGASEISSIEIIDILGNTIKQIDNKEMNNHLEININSYSIATYLLKINTQKNQYFYKFNKY